MCETFIHQGGVILLGLRAIPPEKVVKSLAVSKVRDIIKMKGLNFVNDGEGITTRIQEVSGMITYLRAKTLCHL